MASIYHGSRREIQVMCAFLKNRRCIGWESVRLLDTVRIGRREAPSDLSCTLGFLQKL